MEFISAPPCPNAMFCWKWELLVTGDRYSRVITAAARPLSRSGASNNEPADLPLDPMWRRIGRYSESAAAGM
ncbi:hypothetical protein HAX54_013625 [Datura stramonium]|uniref:Uncharacterized protein n=1 Tax=Datura stramonium TaxID=4076 RepID=A0ABS8TN29_DATST|nr:hypothetical protein [Datura stramonium]